MDNKSLATQTRVRRSLGFEDLSKILAHRFPLLMLDTVLDFEPGKRIVGIKNVTANEIHFLGHFPSIAIMPGALIIEALAQTLQVLDALSREAEPENVPTVLKYLGSVNMTFMEPVLPGNQLWMEVEIVKMIKLGVVGKAKAQVDGRNVAKGDLVLMLKEDASSG